MPRFLADINTLLGKAKNLGASSTTGVPQGLSPKVQATIERSVKDAKVDIYTGVDDHALRRLALTVDLVVPKDAQKQAGGLKSGQLRFDLTIADLNKEQTINAPAGARPFSELQSQLAALQGGTGSARRPRRRRRGPPPCRRAARPRSTSSASRRPGRTSRGPEVRRPGERRLTLAWAGRGT